MIGETVISPICEARQLFGPFSRRSLRRQVLHHNHILGPVVARRAAVHEYVPVCAAPERVGEAAHDDARHGGQHQ